MHQVGSQARVALLVALAVPWLGCAALIAPANPNDQGITSEVHRSHVGKILFSGRPIRFSKEEPGAFQAAFTAGQPLHARMYLAASLATLLQARGQGFDRSGALDVTFSLIIDGEAVGAPSPPTTFLRDVTTYGFAISGDASEHREVAWFQEQLAPLSAGRHTVIIQALGPAGLGGATLAEGRFSYEQSPELAARAAERTARAKARAAEREARLASGLRFLALAEVGCVGAGLRWRVTESVAEKKRTTQKLVLEGEGPHGLWVRPGTRFMLYDSRSFPERALFTGQVTETPNDQAYRWSCDEKRLVP